MKPDRLMLPLLALTFLAACQVSVKTGVDRWSQESSVAELDRLLPISDTVGELVMRGTPELSAQTLARVRQYGNARSASAQGFLGDALLIKTRFGQTAQLHRVGGPGDAREQITFFVEPVGAVTVPPVRDPQSFVFARDVGGSEFFQLFHFDLATGTARRFTDGTARYGNVIYDRSGSRIAYSSTARNGVAYDVYLNDLAGNERVVYESPGGLWYPLDFSPDGAKLLIGNYRSINESTVHEVDLRSGVVTQLFAELPPSAIPAASYAEDGASVIFATDAGTEFVQLRRLDLRSGRVSRVSGDINWNVEDFVVGPGGDRVAYLINENGLSQLVVKNLRSGVTVALPALPKGIVYGLGFNADGSALRLNINTPTTPGDAYVLNLRSRTLTRWTYSETGGLNPDVFVQPELISYPTFDGVDGGQREIPAFFYRPEGSGPFATMIYIHGGPEAQFRPYFSSTLQYFASELGLAILAPNVRGSAGYGKTYLKLDNGRLREDSVKDIGAALDWISEQPELDPERVVVYGGSYGGYMVLASLTNYPERIAAAMESVGISNFVTFLENTQPYRQDLRRVEYGDERDPEMRAFLEEISPLNRVEEIAVPLLIAQGANDPRVPAGESDQIAVALAARKIPVWYLLAGDEGHGFRKKRNREQYVAAMAAFLEQYLLRESP